MNLFELWMDNMFFLHFIFATLGIGGFIYGAYRFKKACDIEQKENISGTRYRPSKKEDREEQTPYEDLPEEEQQYEYQENESSNDEYSMPETDNDDEEIGNTESDDEDSSEQEYQEEENNTDEDSYNNSNSEYEDDSETENDSNEEYSQENDETYTGNYQAEKPSYTIGEQEYQSIQQRLEMAEKNISAASKGFRQMADRLTDLEKQFDEIPEPNPVEKTAFASSINKAIKEIRSQISEMQEQQQDQDSDDEDSDDDYISEIQEDIEELSNEIENINKKYSENADSNKISVLEEKLMALQKQYEDSEQDNETIKDLKENIVSLTKKNEDLAIALEDMKARYSELEAGISNAINETSKSLQENIDNLQKPQSLDESETIRNVNGQIKDIQAEIENLKNNVGKIPESKPLAEDDSFKKLLELVNKTTTNTIEMDERISLLENELSESIASKKYIIDMVAKLSGEIDNMSKDEIRVKLRQIEQDIMESYMGDEEETEEEEEDESEEEEEEQQEQE